MSSLGKSSNEGDRWRRRVLWRLDEDGRIRDALKRSGYHQHRTSDDAGPPPTQKD